MKRFKTLLVALCLLAALSASASAGTMEMPGVVPTPPPSEPRAAQPQPETGAMGTFTRLTFDLFTGFWKIL